MHDQTQRAATHDVLTPARIRGDRARARLVARAGGLLSSQQIAERLGVSVWEIDVLRRQNEILAVCDSEAGWRYPACQIVEGRLVVGLSRFLAELGDLDPWTRLAVFLAPSARFDGYCALDLLKQGREREARSIAATYSATES